MTDPTTPTTEAGRDGQYTLCHFETCAGMKGPNDCDCGVVRTILAIEAQARADERRRLAGLVGLAPPVHIAQAFTATDHGATEHRPDDCLYRGDFLAIINADTEPAP